MPAFELQVGESEAGERLDVALARRISHLSRRQVRGLIEAGQVRVAGKPSKKGYQLRAGDRVTIEALPGPADFYAEPDPDLEIDVVLETEGFVVALKPPGVPSHPLRPGERGTLAGALVARYPEMRDVGYGRREPGLVHRLDTGTSGLILAARNAAAFDELRAQLRAGKIEKRYLARCVGEVRAPFVIDAPIANDPSDRRKTRACADVLEAKRLNAQPARTEVLSSRPALHGSLVEVRADFARRHQIRVHLASIGHPLLGDPLYGGPRLEGIDHHLLHAAHLCIGTLSVSATPWNHEDSAPKVAAPNR